MYANSLRFYDEPPPPPPPEMPPLPPGPPPPPMVYHFGDTTSQVNGRPHGVHAEQAFAFRNGDNAPRYPKHDIYRPSPSNLEEDRMAERRTQHGREPSRRTVGPGDLARRRASQPYRGRPYHKPHTAQRPLLNFQRGNTPEQLAGMNDDKDGARRFLNIDDMSDSQEEDMEVSDQEIHELTPDNAEIHNGHIGERLPDEAVEDNLQAVGGQTSSEKKSVEEKEISAVPKWSNPEYYTALPPPDESQRKRKDFVKLIRKARVANETKENTRSQAAANVDFISFDFEDDDQSLTRENGDKSDSSDYGKGVPGAPSGPRNSMVHGRENARVPGVNGVYTPIDVIGPPPSSMTVLDPGTANPEIPLQDGNKKRKRPNDSATVEVLRAPKRKKGVSAFSGGYVLDEWRSPKSLNPIPWATQSHDLTENPGFR